MYRARVVLSVLAVFAAGAVASAQSNCCPPQVPPSCMAPTCLAPSCVAPDNCNSCNACYGDYCSAGCRQCNAAPCSSGPRKWLKRSIHIDLSRTIIKKNNWGGPSFGEAPPSGFAVASMPVLPLNVSAVPVGFTSASVNSNDQLVSAMIRMLKDRDTTSATTSASKRNTCDDPCGQILQLEDDVRQLTAITRNLTKAVEKLAKNQQDDTGE